MKKMIIIAFIMLLILVQNFNVNSFPIDNQINNASIKNSDSNRIQQIDTNTQSSNSKIDSQSTNYKISYPLYNTTWDGLNEESGYKIAKGVNHTLFSVGETTTASSGYDLQLLAWNTSTNQVLWNRTWGGGGTDSGNGVAVSNDTIYTVGTTNSFGNGGNDVVLIAWDYAGNLLWYRTWGTDANQEGLGIALSLANDSIYTVGYTFPNRLASSTDVLLISWNTAGGINWNKTLSLVYNGRADAIAVNSDGTIYTAGWQQYGSTITYSYFQLLTWADNGTFLRESKFNYSLADNLNDIVINPFNSTIYTIGQYYDGSVTDNILIAWNLNGTKLWYQTHQGAIGYGITIDTDAEVIYITGVISTISNIWISAYTFYGKLLSSYTWSGSTSENTHGIVIVDSSLYIIGSLALSTRDVLLLHTFLYEVPSSPLNLSAIFNKHVITLSWNYPLFTGGLSLQQFYIYRSDAVNGTFVYLDTSSCLNYNDTSALIGGTTYYYEIRALNSIASGLGSNIAFSTYYTVPSDPFNLKVTNQNQSISISWDVPKTNGGKTIASYNIYRSDNISNGFVLINTITNNSFIDYNVTHQMNYYYMVSAVNTIGESQYSNEISASVFIFPDGPSNLSVTVFNRDVKLIWNSSTSSGDNGPLSFNIYRSVNNSGYHFLTNVNRTEFDDYNVSPLITYNYFIKAVNSIGLSNSSNIASISPLFVPTRPLRVLISHDKDGNIFLSWRTPVSNGGRSIYKYNIYKGINNSTNLFLLNSTSYLNFTDYSTNLYDHNYYIITAVNLIGESQFSVLVDSYSSPYISTIILINTTTGSSIYNSSINSSINSSSIRASLQQVISTANLPVFFMLAAIPILALYKRRK